MNPHYSKVHFEITDNRGYLGSLIYNIPVFGENNGSLYIKSLLIADSLINNYNEKLKERKLEVARDIIALNLLRNANLYGRIYFPITKFPEITKATEQMLEEKYKKPYSEKKKYEKNNPDVGKTTYLDDMIERNYVYGFTFKKEVDKNCILTLMKDDIKEIDPDNEIKYHVYIDLGYNETITMKGFFLYIDPSEYKDLKGYIGLDIEKYLDSLEYEITQFTYMKHKEIRDIILHVELNNSEFKSFKPHDKILLIQ